jgi:HAMP domain-containing protein
MEAGHAPLSSAHPLPKLDEVGDSVLAAPWSPFDSPILDLPGLDVQTASMEESNWLILLKRVPSISPGDLTIGMYMPKTVIGRDIENLRWAAGASASVLLISLVGAALLGRRMADPMRQLAVHATAVSRLDLQALTPLPRSSIRELEAQNAAFNAMVLSLRWFATYIPRSLVHRLISRADPSGIPAVERTVTVMFTDIVGFTLEAEGPATPQRF